MISYIEYLTTMRNEVQKRDNIDVDDFVQLCDLLIERATPEADCLVGHPQTQGDQRLRTCCVCGVQDIPQIDWQWWQDGKPVHQACQGIAPPCKGIGPQSPRAKTPMSPKPEDPPSATVTTFDRALVAKGERMAITNRGRIEAALRKLGVTSADSQYGPGRWGVEDLAVDLSPLLDTSNQQRVTTLERIADLARKYVHGCRFEPESNLQRELRDVVDYLDKQGAAK